MSGEVDFSVPNVVGPRGEKLFFRAQRERIPIAGGIELTHRCNLACVHCYVNLAPNDRAAQRREMTTEQVFRVIDQLVEAGTLYLTFTGGEPLLRPDFAEIYTYAQERGFILAVYTNATLITERIVNLWVERPPRVVEITQYGFSREVYDQVTDAGAQYDRFMRGVERLRSAGIKITLKAMALRDNVHELPLIRQRARAEGFQFRFDAIISPRIDGGKKPLAQRLTPAEVAAIEAGDEVRQELYAEYCEDTSGVPADDRRYQCGAGISTFVIDPYGKMHVCNLSRRPGWDVLRDGFEAGFRVAFPALRAERRTHTEGCGSCAAHSSCSNCPGMSELEARSPDDGDLYFCRVTDARQANIFGERHPIPNGLVKLRLRGDHERESNDSRTL